MPHHRLTDKDGFHDSEFILKVQMGHIPFASYTWKFGYSGVNLAGVPNTIWDHNPGLYPYHLGYGVEAKQIDLVSDTPVSDNGREILINGLDSEGYDQSEVMTIGTTSIKTYSRLFRMQNK